MTDMTIGKESRNPEEQDLSNTIDHIIFPSEFCRAYERKLADLYLTAYHIIIKRKMHPAYENQHWIVRGVHNSLGIGYFFPNGELPSTPKLKNKHVRKLGDVLRKNFIGLVEFYHIRTGKIVEVDVDELKIVNNSGHDNIGVIVDY